MLLLKHPTLCLPAEHSLRIETGAIMAFPVRQGQLMTIVDERGGQPAALFGVDAADSRHFVSPHHTRVFSNSFILRLGMRVVTNRRRPAMVLGRDTVGAHDLLMPSRRPATEPIAKGRASASRTRCVRLSPGNASTSCACPIRSISFSMLRSGQTALSRRKGVVSSAKSSVTFRVVMDLIVAVAAPLPDEKLWRGSASGVLAVHVHNCPDASFE